jgi:hypothetical protein
MILVGARPRHALDMALTTAGERPRLRGVSHHVAFYVAVIAGAVLVASSHDSRTTIATTI